ncbi:MAG: ATP-binding protein [Candidatus Micrarchaeota archaeon]|nr:ATP-binding protein [Candidatus Micrarchaeota archaeon]
MVFDRFVFKEVHNSDIGARNPLNYPPQPPPEILFGDPTDGIYIGRTDALNTPFYWNPKELTNPHIVIVGITGSGKSYTIKSFLIRASIVWEANAIIIDWAGEYKEWVTQSKGKVIALGKGNYLNLLDLGGMKPYARIQQIVETLDLLTGVGRFPDQKRLLEWALEKAYLEAGFKLDSTQQFDELGRPLEPPTLKDVVRILEEKKELEVQARSFIAQEIENLIYKLKQFTRPGDDFFANKSTISLDELISSGLVDLDLSGLPNETMRALGALTVIQFIKEKMRTEDFRKTQGKIRLFVVIDEAWKISKDENSDIVMIVREGRKYGFSLIVASQNPTDIAEAIFSNAGTVFILKIKFENYLNYLQGSLRFSDYVRERILGFGVGQAAVNMAFHTPGKYVQTFILERIEGEEPLRDYFIMLNVVGDPMGSVSIRRDIFRARLRELGLSAEKVDKLSTLFDKNSNHLDIVTLIIEMDRLGMERKKMVEFFKELGIDDQTIIKALARAQAQVKGVDKSAELKLR